MSRPPPFPSGAAGIEPTVPSVLHQRGIALRPARDADLPFLRQLYQSLRAEELAPLQWPPSAVQVFADSQFALQHAHYLDHYHGADFLLVEQHGEPVGRYYLFRGAPDYVVVDISLCAGTRRQGVGGALIAHTQREASERGCGVHLHVRCDNAGAKRLYRRLGFTEGADHGGHLSMSWRPTIAPAS
ncbi:N-acetyltransferase family protein [Lysobacter sp. A378]